MSTYFALLAQIKLIWQRVQYFSETIFFIRFLLNVNKVMQRADFFTAHILRMFVCLLLQKQLVNTNRLFTYIYFWTFTAAGLFVVGN